MTVIQIVALICLPLVWAMVANGPSRSAMQRMRRNARRGGPPVDVAFDRWMRRNGRDRDTGDRLRSASPEDQAAFALVAAAAAEIEAAMLKGELTREAKDRVAREHARAWAERCDPLTAGRAAEMLERCGPAEFLAPGQLARSLLPRPPS